MPESLEERKRRRATAEVRVVRGDEPSSANAAHDANYWLRVPVEKRAEFVWELSVDAFSLRAAR